MVVKSTKCLLVVENNAPGVGDILSTFAVDRYEIVIEMNSRENFYSSFIQNNSSLVEYTLEKFLGGTNETYPLAFIYTTI